MHSNQFFITRPTGIAKYKMQIAQINFLFVVFYATKKKCASFIGNVLLQYTEPDKPDENHRCPNGYTKSEETKDLFSKNTLPSKACLKHEEVISADGLSNKWMRY